MIRLICISSLLNLFFSYYSKSQTLISSDFKDDYIRGIWNPSINDGESLMGITFDDLGRMYVWTKGGRIYTAHNNQEAWSLMLDISDKIVGSFDSGLIGFALDPNYITNGLFYVFYTVNSQNIPITNNSTPDATMGRVSRYKVVNPNAYSPTTDYNSSQNKILIGETASTGIPYTVFIHLGGTLVFGTDESLIISTGDGAYPSNNDNGSDPNTNFQSALNNGIMTSAENVGSNRAQMLNSLCGKLLRIDPNTGDGLPNNPFYDGNNPRSAQSRIWSIGLRNPFRIIHIHDTGNPIDDPGHFLVADVGQGDKEEYNLVTQGGQNFGWPRYEGMTKVHTTRTNPAFWPSIHTLPIVDYRTGQGRALKNGLIYNVGSIDVPGSNPFEGNSAMAGMQYHGGSFPAEYDDAFFMMDGDGSISTLKLDANNNVVSLNHFETNIPGTPISMAQHPIDGSIYYIGHIPAIRRIYYNPGNHKPVAQINADSLFKNDTLVVSAFTAINSYDLDNETLTYEWDFGDGSPVQTGLAPHHVFKSNTPHTYTVKLTVKDPQNAQSIDYVKVYVENSPPVITSTSLDAISVQANQPLSVTLSASATDAQTAPANLTYKWEIYMAHNGHQHLESTVLGNNSPLTLPSLACELGVASYWYRIALIVSDPSGLSDTLQRDVPIDCGSTPQTISFAPIANQLTTNAAFNPSVSVSSGLTVSLFKIEGPAYISNNTTINLTGIPGKVVIRALQHGNQNYNQAPLVEQSFFVSRPINSQTVSFPQIPNKNVNDNPFTLSASASSGLAIEFVLISGPATINGNTLTLTGQEGNVRIRAVQKGNYATNGAYVEQVFQVTNPCPNIKTIDSSLPNNTTYQASQNIISNVPTQIGSIVEYRAGNSIELNPGFATNGTFKAYIGSCN